MFKPPPEPPPRQRDKVRITTIVALAIGWVVALIGWLLTLL
ncbi:hypothetical protein [Haloactinopolyspora sp.]|nr:hypothetical protein [Haloactinopolyspora sp.]